MSVLRKPLLFTMGGCGYVGLELLWRGWSHGSMFFAGGCAFLLLGQVDRRISRLSGKALLGAGAITAVELLAGLIANRDYSVWDYRGQPLNFMGQICLPFSLLWIPVGLGGMVLYRLLDKGCNPKERGF